MKKKLNRILSLLKSIIFSIYKKTKTTLNEEYTIPNIKIDVILKLIPLIYFLGLIYNYWYFDLLGLKYFWYFDIKDVFVTNSEFWIFFTILFLFIGIVPIMSIINLHITGKDNRLKKITILIISIFYFFIICLILKFYSNTLLKDWFSLYPLVFFFILIPFISKKGSVFMSVIILFSFTLYSAKLKAISTIRIMKTETYNNTLEIYNENNQAFFGKEYKNQLLIENLSNYFIFYENINCNYLVYNKSGKLKYKFPIPLNIEKKIDEK